MYMSYCRQYMNIIQLHSPSSESRTAKDNLEISNLANIRLIVKSDSHADI